MWGGKVRAEGRVRKDKKIGGEKGGSGRERRKRKEGMEI